MAERCRAVDWSATPLGATATWPKALRTVVRLAMECPFPILLWCGTDLTLVYNDAYRAVLGSKHPGALGRPGRVVWSEIWDEIRPLFDSVRAGTPVYAENGRFVMERVGDVPADAWFTYSLSAVRDADHEIVGFFNVAAETTGQVLNERALAATQAAAERAERQLREVFAQAPAFLAVLHGPTHVFQFANDAYLRLIGRTSVTGLTVAEALPEIVEQGFITLLDDVVSKGKPIVGREVPVLLARTRGGVLEQRFIDFVYQPLTGEDGANPGIVIHGTDVTEDVHARDEIERLLRVSEQARSDAEASEARYRFLADSIPVQVWTADPSGALDYVSQRTAEYFGVQEDSVLGDRWLAQLHQDDVDRTVGRWMQSIATGAPYEVEFRVRSVMDDGYRWHLARAQAQRDEHGAIIQWFGTNTDIEDWKRAEAELRRLTIEATEANRAKSDFLAAMSHELRTPLNAIGGYAQLIEMGVRGAVTDEQRIDLLKIQRSKDHLQSLVSDVLNFAKAGIGRIEYRMDSVNVQATLESVLEMIAPQVAEKALRLVPAESAPTITVVGDEDKVRQVLLNLLANSLKFTPAGGTVALDVSTTDADVSISVTDTGIGVPADKIESIFEPFVQAERALHARDQGVGLGLAISRQLARAMRGELTAVSESGRGSTFTLTLPRA